MDAVTLSALVCLAAMPGECRAAEYGPFATPAACEAAKLALIAAAPTEGRIIRMAVCPPPPAKITKIREDQK